MVQSESDTALIIEAELYPGQATTNLDMVVTSPTNMSEPCLVYYSLTNASVCGEECKDDLKVQSFSRISGLLRH